MDTAPVDLKAPLKITIKREKDNSHSLVKVQTDGAQIKQEKPESEMEEDRIIANAVPVKKELKETPKNTKPKKKPKRKPKNDSDDSDSDYRDPSEVLNHNCEQCSKSFRHRSKYLLHVSQVHGTGKHSCDICSKTFKCQSYLNHHKKKQHQASGEIRKCDICNKEFINGYLLDQHNKSVHSSVKECKLCHKKLKNRSSLYTHMKYIHDSIFNKTANLDDCFKCDTCLQTFTLEDDLLEHVFEMHSINSYDCPVCLKNFSCLNYLNKHISQIHVGKESKLSSFHCDNCLLIFYRKCDLEGHIELAHSLRIHKCNLCDKAYKRTTCLVAHIKTVHTVEEHPCKVCSKVFKGSKALASHMIKVHSIHKCTICCRRYISIESLNEHVNRVHSNTSWECAMCNQVFKCKKMLQHHTKIVHSSKSEEKPCLICSTSYKNAYYLYLHHRNVHGGRPWECADCCKKFRVKSLATKHIIAQHCFTSTDEKFNKCNKCYKIFGERKDLYDHVHLNECSHIIHNPATLESVSEVASSSKKEADTVMVKEEAREEPVEEEMGMACEMFQISALAQAFYMEG